MGLVRAIALLAASLPLLLVAAHASAQTSSSNACVSAFDSEEALRAKGDLLGARSAAARCAADACPAAMRPECARVLSDLEIAIPTVVFVARSEDGDDLPGVSVMLDGTMFRPSLDGRAAEVNPGQHTFRFAAPGLPPVDKSVVVLEREKGRVIEARFARNARPVASTAEPALFPEAPAAPGASGRSVSPLVIALGGVGALGLASGTIFGVRSVFERNDLESCRPCSEAQLDSVRTGYRVSEVSFAVGVVAVTAALVLYFTQSNDAPAVAIRRSQTGIAPLRP